MLCAGVEIYVSEESDGGTSGQGVGALFRISQVYTMGNILKKILKNRILYTFRVRSALFNAENRVISRRRSVFKIFWLRSEKRHSRPNRSMTQRQPITVMLSTRCRPLSRCYCRTLYSSAALYPRIFLAISSPGKASGAGRLHNSSTNAVGSSDRHDAALREADEFIRQAKLRKFAIAPVV